MQAQRTFCRPGKVNRSQRDKVFAGVCGGLAEHFDVSSTWLRVGFIIGAVTTFPVVPIIYIICIFVMPQAGGSRRARAAAWDEVPPPPPPAQSQTTMDEVNEKFALIDAKIRLMEDYVTSKEYILKRKFEDL